MREVEVTEEAKVDDLRGEAIERVGCEIERCQVDEPANRGR